MDILTNFLYQTVFTVGVIVVFGLLLALCRRLFCMVAGACGTGFLLATGIVGTPIHELSHALMCVVFGHRIVEMKLYSPGSRDGTLGYVNHSYNPRNPYQQIGNFFIGIAPILGGSAVLLLLMRWLVPDVFSAVTADLSAVNSLSLDFADRVTYTGYVSLFRKVTMDIFDFSQAGNILWWVFLLLALSVAGHMELSGADVKGGVGGFFLLSLLLLLADAVLYFVSRPSLSVVTEAMTSFALPTIGFLAVAGIFSVAMLLLAAVLRLVLGIFLR